MTEPHTVVLVEGDSDRIAVQTLAQLVGRDLAAEGVAVLAMAGVTNIRAFALRYGPRGLGLRLVGLYDVAEVAVVRRGLRMAGLSVDESPNALAQLGFHACEADLEDELIRALGVSGVEAVIEEAGETASLRRLAGMPAQQGWSREDVLHRFLGSRSGRKARYAELFVRALGPERAPTPLRAVLAEL